MLDSLITSKTRIRLLVKFFINAANAGYLRGLATEMNENTNAIRKELNNLSEAGYITREVLASKVMYRANA
jgi:predicted ArsR family transcriptional regulator